MLDGVFDILQWKDGQEEALDLAEFRYMSWVAGNLGHYLRQIEAEGSELPARILALLSQADAKTLRRVVLAPETTSRVLYAHPGGCDDRSLGQYLVELLESGPEQPSEVGLVVDSDSSAAVCFDYSTLRDGGMRLEHYSDPAARELAIGRLASAMRGIDATDGGVASIVRRYTLVANVLVDSENPKFTSGSTSQYVGRSLFCNAHLPSVDTELLADSLVHEAIHSLLYMHELCEPWILDEALITRCSVVESPWSGATLMVRPFLQACFVWFGLTNFWMRAQRRSTFHPERVAARLATARGGFLNGPLGARLADYKRQISPTLLELVGAMQEMVLKEVNSRR